MSPSGNDGAGGTTDATPWKTLDWLNSKLTDGSVSQGDVVLFERGQEFSGFIKPLNSYATTGDFLTFGLYGKASKGRRAIISAYRDLTVSGGWSNHGGGVWKIDLSNASNYTGLTGNNGSSANTGNVGHLLVDGVIYGARRVALEDLANPWDFYVDDANDAMLYVKASANPTTLATTIRAATNGSVAYPTTSTKWCGLELIGAAEGLSYFSAAATRVRASDLYIHHIGGVRDPYAGGTLSEDGVDYLRRMGNGMSPFNGLTDLVAERCDFSHIYDGAFAPQIASPTAGVTDFINDVVLRHSRIWACRYAFELFSNGTAGAGTGFNRMRVEDNQAYIGESWSDDIRPSGDHPSAHFVTFTWTLGASDVKVRRNLLYGNPTAYRYQSSSNESPAGNAPTGVTWQDNELVLADGTLMKYLGLAGAAGRVTGVEDQTITEAADWADYNDQEVGSTFHVLPASAPTEVDDAIAQAFGEIITTDRRAKTVDSGLAAVRGELEQLKEQALTPTRPMRKVTVQAQRAADVPLIVKGASGQTAALMHFHDSAGATLAAVNADGSVRAPVLGSTSSGKATISTGQGSTNSLFFNANVATNVPGIVQGAVSQSADLWRWQYDTGSGSRVVARVTHRNLFVGQQTTLAGGGEGVLGISNAEVVPTTNPTSGGIAYAEGGALKWRGSSGTVTTIAPA